MKNIIALDIGGTSIKSAIIKSDGSFLENSCKISEIDSSQNKYCNVGTPLARRIIWKKSTLF